MVQLYNSLHNTAIRLIKKYGYSKAEYYHQIELANEWDNTFNSKLLLVDIIILPSSKYSRETYKLQSNRDLIESNYLAYMPHSNFIPTINDYLIVNGVRYEILNIIRINPNGTDIIYKMELK